MILMLGTNDTKARYAVSAEEIGFGLQRDLEEIETFFRYKRRPRRHLSEDFGGEPGADAGHRR